jgi:predicted transcriptional regulator
MENKRLFEGEARFMDIIWDSEPVPSGKLVELCNEKLGWKKSTTYTMIKRLSEKGLVKNENSTVTALVTREEVRAAESSFVVVQTFAGSLPSFLVSFLGGKKISKEEADELKEMIDRYSK